MSREKAMDKFDKFERHVREVYGDMSDWRTSAERAAITRAQALARDLGHAAVIATRGRKGYERYEVFDSWAPLDDGWTPAMLVSSTGKVVACAETE